MIESRIIIGKHLCGTFFSGIFLDPFLLEKCVIIPSLYVFIFVFMYSSPSPEVVLGLKSFFISFSSFFPYFISTF